MHKYLMITAAAVLANGASAFAGTGSFVFATAGGGTYCDSGMVVTAIGGNKAVRAWTHVPFGGNGTKSSWGGTCAGGTSQGQGLLGKVKGLGTVSEMSDTLMGKNYDNYSEQLSYVLPKNIKSGQPWSLWAGMSGTTSFEVNSGVLVNAGPIRHGARTAARVKQLTGAR